MNKKNKGITEVKMAPLILFNLSLGHVILAFELVIRAGCSKNSVFKYFQTSQSCREKVSACFLSILE